MTSWPPSVETMVDDPARQELQERKGRPVSTSSLAYKEHMYRAAGNYDALEALQGAEPVAPESDIQPLLWAYFDLTRELRTNPERWRPDKQENLDMLHQADELAEKIQALRP